MTEFSPAAAGPHEAESALLATRLVAIIRLSDHRRVVEIGAAGIRYLRALRGPLPQARIIPTGRVTIEDAGAWLRAGAAAVALGSDLVDRAGTLDGLADRAFQAVEATKEVQLG